ncbi:MAG: sulfite exporter TauE/SafE family protein [Candidatus Acidiferrum sp.]
MVAARCETREDRVHAHGDENEPPERSCHPSMTLIVLLLGLVVGVLVGLLGIGGGVVLVPALVYLLHMDQHLAQGTSLLILLPPVGLGALREYWKQGQVDLRAGILCALGILVGGYLGGLIAVPLASRQLQGLFGCFLMLAAFLLWRKPQPQSEAASIAGEDSARG